MVWKNTLSFSCSNLHSRMILPWEWRRIWKILYFWALCVEIYSRNRFSCKCKALYTFGTECYEQFDTISRFRGNVAMKKDNVGQTIASVISSFIRAKSSHKFQLNHVSSFIISPLEHKSIIKRLSKGIFSHYTLEIKLSYLCFTFRVHIMVH